MIILAELDGSSSTPRALVGHHPVKTPEWFWILSRVWLAGGGLLLPARSLEDHTIEWPETRLDSRSLCPNRWLPFARSSNNRHAPSYRRASWSEWLRLWFKYIAGRGLWQRLFGNNYQTKHALVAGRLWRQEIAESAIIDESRRGPQAWPPFASRLSTSRCLRQISSWMLKQPDIEMGLFCKQNTFWTEERRYDRTLLMGLDNVRFMYKAWRWRNLV